MINIIIAISVVLIIFVIIIIIIKSNRSGDPSKSSSSSSSIEFPNNMEDVKKALEYSDINIRENFFTDNSICKWHCWAYPPEIACNWKACEGCKGKYLSGFFGTNTTEMNRAITSLKDRLTAKDKESDESNIIAELGNDIDEKLKKWSWNKNFCPIDESESETTTAEISIFRNMTKIEAENIIDIYFPQLKCLLVLLFSEDGITTGTNWKFRLLEENNKLLLIVTEPNARISRIIFNKLLFIEWFSPISFINSLQQENYNNWKLALIGYINMIRTNNKITILADLDIDNNDFITYINIEGDDIDPNDIDYKEMSLLETTDLGNKQKLSAKYQFETLKNTENHIFNQDIGEIFFGDNNGPFLLELVNQNCE